MAMKKGLGRGLDALFESYREETETADEAPGDKGKNQIQEIRVNDIDPNPDQPRKQFTKEGIQELADSIRSHGVVQPIIVKKSGLRYQIVAGERRWRAAREAGLLTIPAMIMDLTEKEVIEIGLIENLQREDLNPIEEAQGIQQLVDKMNLTQEEAAERLGRSRPAVANALRLLQLSGRIQEYLSEKRITTGHAKALLSIEDKKLREEVAEMILVKNLNVRDTEKIIQNINKKKIKKTAKEKPGYITEIENGLEESLGTKVQIRPGAKKGIIEIEYYSNEDLERIINRVSYQQ